MTLEVDRASDEALLGREQVELEAAILLIPIDPHTRADGLVAGTGGYRCLTQPKRDEFEGKGLGPRAMKSGVMHRALSAINQ